MLHPGWQGFGELGPWDHWRARAEQSHRSGPAMFITIGAGDAPTIKVQAAWLLGKTYGDRGHMFTMQAKVEF